MTMTMSIRLIELMAIQRYGTGPVRRGFSASPAGTLIIGPVVFLTGEWVPAWAYMSLALLVASVGVVGLGWWVLRGDARNRRRESSAAEDTAEQH